MKRLSEFCKAYPYDMLAAYAAFPKPANGAGEADAAKEYLFVHDDYTVTEGIYHGEDVVLGEPTEEWKTYCRETLQFSPPLPDEEANTPLEVVETAPVGENEMPEASRVEAGTV